MSDTPAQTVQFDSPAEQPSAAAQPQAGDNAPQTVQFDAPATPPTDPNSIPASTKYAGAPSTEQPGFVKRAIDNSGAGGIGNFIGQAGGYIGTMPGRTMNRVQGIQEAYAALKQGDLHKASMIAHTLATGPDDPVTEMAKNIIKMPFEEAVEAYKALRNQAVDDPTAYLTAAQHGIRAIPVIGPGAEQVGSNIAEDFHNNNWAGLSGDIVGILPSLLFGAEGKAAEAAEASGAEGAAEAATEAKRNAIRPSQRMIGRTPVTVSALQDPNPSLRARALKLIANDPASAQAKMIAQRTAPEAATATVTSLEDVARKRIQSVRDEMGIHTPFESDMSTISKQADAMRESAQEIYQKFDKAAEQEQEDYKTQTALDKEQHELEQDNKEAEFNEDQKAKKEAFDKEQQAKVEKSADKETPYKAKPFKAEKFEAEDFKPEDRPLTFNEMQIQRRRLVTAMQKNAIPYAEGEDAIKKIEGQMDDFAQRHSDVVSPEDYKLANDVYTSATKHDFLAKRIKIAVGTDEIPTAISKGSLSALPQAFDQKFGPDAFENYLGPKGLANYNAVRNVLENPAQASLLVRFVKSIMGEAVGAGAGALSGEGQMGVYAGMAAKYSAGHIAENLLFNPEYGQSVLAAYRKLMSMPSTTPGRIASGVGQIAPTTNTGSQDATHVWSPNAGVQPIQ